MRRRLGVLAAMVAAIGLAVPASANAAPVETCLTGTELVEVGKDLAFTIAEFLKSGRSITEAEETFEVLINGTELFAQIAALYPEIAWATPATGSFYVPAAALAPGGAYVGIPGTTGFTPVANGFIYYDVDDANPATAQLIPGGLAFAARLMVLNPTTPYAYDGFATTKETVIYQAVHVPSSTVIVKPDAVDVSRFAAGLLPSLIATASPEAVAPGMVLTPNIAPASTFLNGLLFGGLKGFGDNTSTALALAGEAGAFDLLEATNLSVTAATNTIAARTADLRGTYCNDNVDMAWFRAENAVAAAAADYAAEGLWRVWANPFATWDSRKIADLRNGYNLDIYGIALGVDRKFGNFFAGAAFVYAASNYGIKGFDAKSDISGWTANLYGGFFANNFFGRLNFGYTWHNYDSKLINYAAGRLYADNHDGSSFNIDAQFGYDIGTCAGFVIRPTIGLEYVRSEVDSYVMGSPFNPYSYAYDKAKRSSLRTPIMLEIEKDFAFPCTVLKTNLHGGWVREWQDDIESFGANVMYRNIGAGTAAASIANYNVNTLEPIKNRGTVGVAVSGTLFSRIDVGVGYDFEWASDYRSHNGNVSFGFKW